MSNESLNRKWAGFSIIEMSVTLLLLTVVLLILYELIIGTMKTSMFVESHNDLTVYGQRVVNSLQTDLLQTRQIWDEDAGGVGDAYRTLFLNAIAALPQPVTVWANSRMPLIDPGGNPPTFDGLLDPDGGGETFVGNSLLLIRSLEPVTVPCACDLNNDGTDDITGFSADRYQLKFYFLSPNSARSFRNAPSPPASPYYLDLVEVSSQVYADYGQLQAVFGSMADPADDQEIANGLLGLPGTIPASERLRLGITAPINEAWTANQPVSAAFYNLDGAANLTLNANPTLTVRVKSMVPEMRGGRISGKMEYTLGFNSSTPNMNFIVPIPQFAIASSNFPGGFEVKVVGPSSHRKVLTRVVLLSEHMSVINSQENFVITATRAY